MFRPTDRRCPRVRVRTKQGAELIGRRIVVVIDSWDRGSLYPVGHFVRDLGAVGDKDSESEAILIMHDVPYNPFSQDVLAVRI